MTPLDWTPTADSTDPFMLTPSMADGKGASTNCDAVGCHVFLTVWCGNHNYSQKC